MMNIKIGLTDRNNLPNYFKHKLLFSEEQAVIIAMQLPIEITSLSEITPIMQALLQEYKFNDCENDEKLVGNTKLAKEIYEETLNLTQNKYQKELREHFRDLIALDYVENQNGKLTRIGLKEYLTFLDKIKLASSIEITKKPNYELTVKDLAFMKQLLEMLIRRPLGNISGHLLIKELNKLLKGELVELSGHKEILLSKDKLDQLINKFD